MLKLFTRELTALGCLQGERSIAKLTENILLPAPLRAHQICLLRDGSYTDLPDGFLAYFLAPSVSSQIKRPDTTINAFVLSKDQDYLSDGDIVRFEPQKLALKTLYRRNSKHNVMLVTERCNNYCLMCSQPPKDIDDSYLVAEWLQAIPLMDRSTNAITITGGEPTLLNDDLIAVLRALKNYLPATAVHMLSNGRSFSNMTFTKQLAAVDHHDFMIGIPIYSDVSNIHDYVVQADGAFDETIRGIINLKGQGQKVEIRVVLHKQTYERLPQLAEFLARNLLFVDHVAFMGLEMMGFTRHNLEELWIDPIEYQPQLVRAVETLARYNMNVSVYNHQLCILDKRLWPYNRKSISDWKNEYMPECEPCSKKSECGGFFSSAKLRYSDHIKAYEDIG